MTARSWPGTGDARSSRPIGIGDGGVRALLRALSPAGTRARLTIVIFHRVRPARDELFPGELDATDFRARIEWLRRWFNVLPLGDALAARARGTLPERALSVTFDDGYADNVTIALPILRDLGVHATFFVATAYINGGRMWNDTVIEAIRTATGARLDLSRLGLGVHAIVDAAGRRDAIERVIGHLKYASPARRSELTAELEATAAAPLPADLMMTTAQLRSLAAEGMGIGAHTHTHPILASLDDHAARQEIDGGREALEGCVRQPVTLFAYPNGKPDVDYRAAHVRMVKELGFTGALTTAHGAARAGDDAHELPRFSPWDRTPLRYGLRLARNLATGAARARQ